MSGNRYELYTNVRLSIAFTSALTLSPTDPTDVELLMLDPSGIETKLTYLTGALSRLSVGSYYYDWTPAKSGCWWYKWQGLGAVQITSPDTPVTVHSSKLYPGV